MAIELSEDSHHSQILIWDCFTLGRKLNQKILLNEIQFFFSFYRLVKAYDDIVEFLKNEDELKQTKEYTAAQGIIELAKVELQN